LPAVEIQPEAAPVAYSVTRYTAEQGLPHNRVRALLQTRNGYLWVGTLAGLARFDGLRFKVFDMNNTPEMSSDAINALAEDRQDGSLWINTGQELLRYHHHRFERFDEQHGFPHPFGELWPARQGGLWYSPRQGRLVLLQNRTVRSWQLRDERALGNRLMQVQEDEGGSLLVLMYVGLFGFEPTTGALTRLGPPPQTDRSFRHFFSQTNGTIRLAAREGLWQRTGSEWELIEPTPSSQDQCPERIYPTGDGALWIRWSDAGPPRLARFRAGRSEFVDLSSLPDYPMTQFLQDREGHLWIGTESGLCQLRPKAVQVYAREHGLRNDYVRAVTEGPDGTIWLGTAQGLSGIREGQVTNLPPFEPPASWGRAEGLLADRRGRVWYGAQLNTVAAFERGAWVSPASLSLGESWVRTLYEDGFGRIWAGFDQGVAWLNEAGAVQEFPHALSHPDVRVIHQDRRGDLWFGTYGGGLNRLHDGRITVFATALGEYNNRAWCIHEDADGVFWVGSRDGLNRFVPPGIDEIRTPHSALRKAPSRLASAATNENAGRFFTFTTQHGLHENVVNNVQEDDFGNVWLSGLRGIYRVSRRELNAVAAGREAQARVLAFGEADGMLNSQCNGGVNQPSGCKDRAGRIWFPTARGVAVIDPRTIRPNDVPPPVVIEQIAADQQVIFGDGSGPGILVPDSAGSPARSLGRAEGSRPNSEEKPPARRLPPGRARVVEIHYTGNSFAAPNRMRFKYQLEGHDRDWRYDDDNRRVAFYTNLRPGAYTFRIIACNNHGAWSPTPAESSFALAPYFWQTWLFYVFAGAAVIGLAAAVQAYRLRWQHRLLKLEHQRALADERTRIARDLHDDLGTALTGLALQVEVLRRAAPDGPALADRLAESAAGIRALAERMREVVWAVNPRCDTVLSLASFLEQQAGQFLKADGLRCRLDFPEDIPPLPLSGETRHQLALGVREALANAVRHAAASEIVLSLRVEAGQLIVRVADNGRGFCVTECRAYGRGLANLHARLEKVGGQCQCHSAPGAGTTVELRVPFKPGSSRRPLRP
jgi:signal transduction histidine kinase/ligand-binding sensor domain-containing protein